MARRKTSRVPVSKTGEALVSLQITETQLELLLRILEVNDEFGGEPLDVLFDYLLERQEVVEDAIADGSFFDEKARQRYLTRQRNLAKADEPDDPDEAANLDHAMYSDHGEVL